MWCLRANRDARSVTGNRKKNAAPTPDNRPNGQRNLPPLGHRRAGRWRPPAEAGWWLGQRGARKKPVRRWKRCGIRVRGATLPCRPGDLRHPLAFLPGKEATDLSWHVLALGGGACGMELATQSGHRARHPGRKLACSLDSGSSVRPVPSSPAADPTLQRKLFGFVELLMSATLLSKSTNIAARIPRLLLDRRIDRSTPLSVPAGGRQVPEVPWESRSTPSAIRRVTCGNAYPGTAA